MYQDSTKPAKEFQPPKTILETIGYLRRLLQGSTRILSNSPHTNQYRLASGVMCVLSSCSDPEARYEKFERTVWKRLFERPTLRIWVKSFPGLSLLDLITLVNGEVDLSSPPSTEAEALYLDTNYNLVSVPRKLHAVALELAKETDLVWKNWALTYVAKATEVESHYLLTRDGCSYPYGHSGELYETSLKFLGAYTNGHTEYFVHGELKPERLSTEPAIRNLQIDYAVAQRFVSVVGSFRFGAHYARQELVDTYGTGGDLEVKFLEERGGDYFILEISKTKTKIKVLLSGEHVLVQFGSRYYLYRPDGVSIGKHPFIFGLPAILDESTPEEAFLKYYGVEGGWKGWFEHCAKQRKN